MKNADKIACEPLYKPKSEKYDKDIRTFQGCPTLAVTNGGRIYLGWYAGGTGEPHMENYNLLIYSDDHGVTWSKPLIVIPSSYENRVHALDIQLFTDPSGALHLAWVQNNTDECRGEIPEPHDYQPVVVRDGWVFPDMQHSEWEIVCRNPDADEPEFSEPRFLFHGFLRCKPTFLKNGSWIYCAYDQLTDRYGYYISRDCGKTFTHYAGTKKNRPGLTKRWPTSWRTAGSECWPERRWASWPRPYRRITAKPGGRPRSAASYVRIRGFS